MIFEVRPVLIESSDSTGIVIRTRRRVVGSVSYKILFVNIYIVFAAANVRNKYELSGPLVQYVKNQYTAITGEEPGKNFNIRKIILPKPEKMNLDETDRLNKLAMQVLTSA